MNVIDLLIIVLLAGAVTRGFGEGFVHQLCSSFGFFGGLWLGVVVVEPHVTGLVADAVTKLAVSLLATIGVALIGLIIGEMAGIALKRFVHLQYIVDKADNVLGAFLACVAVLAMVWLTAGAVTSLRASDGQRLVRGAAIVRLLRSDLPPAPNIIASVARFLAPNGFPDVFIGNEPTLNQAVLPTPTALQAAVDRDKASVVKIEGEGCGGIVAGSGFIVGDGFVATNAHVVAGIKNPVILDANGTHHATAVWFDPNLDFAVLRTSHLAGAPLVFNAQTIKSGTPGGVLGYPGGGNFQANSAAVTDEFTALGRNIYGQGQTSRDVYAVQSTIVPGNSGGPLVDLEGQVIGVVFATSTTYDHVGYVLSLTAVLHEIGQAKASNTPVDTGRCAE